MNFSESTNLTGLVEDIDFICGTDSVSFPLKDKARIANRWLYKAVTDLIEVRGRFEFDDTNFTTLPITDTDLVDGQHDYELPADLLKLLAIEIKDANGNYIRLKELDKSTLRDTITDFEETHGIPQFYDITGDSIMLYPAPDASQVTISGGLRFHHIRKIDEFVSTDDTQNPGIPEPFHRIVSLGTAYDWLVIHGTQDKSQAVRNEIEQLRKEMRTFEMGKNRDKKTTIKPKRESYN